MKYLPLFLIIILAFILRSYGLNWDQGFHLHPDERAIVLATLPLQFPTSLPEFLSIQSPLNPHFFAYGNFPLYLLKIVSLIASNFDPSFASYDKINIVGRFISGIFDLGTIFFIFLLGRKLFGKKTGFLASFFYTISVFPIQAAHFYAVDTTLTFFILLTLYQLIRFYEKPTLKKAILVGIFFGLSLATKTSATVLIAAIGITIIIDFLFIFLKNPHRPHIWFPHMSKFLKRLFIDGAIITATTIFTFLIAEPYSLIDFKEFWRQTLEQSRMTNDAFTFPYTLQYVGKIPYLYELKNIFFWGQGPILTTFSLAGFFYTIFLIIKKQKEKKWAQELILVIFFLSYFAVVGKFAIGFMRYMLPLYPLFSLFAALFILKLYAIIKNRLKISTGLFIILDSLFIILVLVWPLSFMNIYTKPNTRVLASEWINKNIPTGSTIAIEHWDDSLPLSGQEKYRMLTLPLYDPDTSEKWETINRKLSKTDYIVIASNRLYAPLMRLTNCGKLPPGRCYSNTAQYYSSLFDNSLGFKKIAEFSISPQLSIFSPRARLDSAKRGETGNFQLSIDDSSADESFTVYDHPRVIIFKKIP